MLSLSRPRSRPETRKETNTRPQHEETFNDFQELSRLCVLGGEESAMCLLRGGWLQEKREEVRNGPPFVLPSRNNLPREAVYSGRIAEDCTFIIVLSYCWASPEHPDPENRLLANVSEFLAYLDVSRHFADDNPDAKELNVGDREVLVFWDWPCLYQKKDGGIAPQQLDSFKRGLQSVNVLYGHVGTLSLLCTEGTIRREVDLTTRGLAGHTSSLSFHPREGPGQGCGPAEGPGVGAHDGRRHEEDRLQQVNLFPL